MDAHPESSFYNQLPKLPHANPDRRRGWMWRRGHVHVGRCVGIARVVVRVRVCGAPHERRYADEAVAVEVTSFEAMVSREATMIALARLAWPSAPEANRENDERACCEFFRSHRQPPLHRE